MPLAQAADGTPLHYRIDGRAGAPVLMLSNSLATDLHMWDDQALTWSEHFRLLRYDYRGHGASGVTNGPYTMELLARDAIAVADTVGAKAFHWCGLSMGGMVGQWLAAYAPTRVQRLVLSNTHYHYADKQFWNERIRYVREHGLATLARPQMDRWFTKGFLDRSPQTVTKVIGMFQATTREGYVACAEAIRDIDFRASTPTIRMPTLVIVGSKDPATPPEAGVAIQQMIGGAKLVTLEASHLSNIEQPMAYGKAVLDFLLAP